MKKYIFNKNWNSKKFIAKKFIFFNKSKAERIFFYLDIITVKVIKQFAHKKDNI